MIFGPARGELRNREVMRLQKAWFSRRRGLKVPTYEPVLPTSRQDGRLDVDALGVNPVFFMKRRHLADGALDMIRFLPRRIVKERDVGFLGGGSFWRQLRFVKRPENRLGAKHKHIRIVC